MQCGYLMKDLGEPYFCLVSHNMRMYIMIYGYKSYLGRVRNDDPNCDKNILYFKMFPKQLRVFQSNYFG